MYSLIRTSELQELRSIQESSKQRIELLEKEIEILKDKLNINSGNSGLPTSKEIYKKEKKARKKSSRKAGGQPGHKAGKYQFKTPDRIHNVDTENCCSLFRCGHRFSALNLKRFCMNFIIKNFENKNNGGGGQGWQKPGFFRKNPTHLGFLGFMGFLGFLIFSGFFRVFWIFDFKKNSLYFININSDKKFNFYNYIIIPI